MPGASNDIGITCVGQIAIRVHDVDRAVAFYRDILGLPLLFTAGKLAFFNCGGVRLMLDVPEKPEFDHTASIIYYLVPDIEAAHTTLRSRGVTFATEPHLVHRAPDHELWLAFFHDSEDNALALMTRKPRA